MLNRESTPHSRAWHIPHLITCYSRLSRAPSAHPALSTEGLHRTTDFFYSLNRSQLGSLRLQTHPTISELWFSSSAKRLAVTPTSTVNTSQCFESQMVSNSRENRLISCNHLHLRKMVVLLKRIFPKLNFFPCKGTKKENLLVGLMS